MIVVPLRDRFGCVTAAAMIDDCDRALASIRWYRLSSGYAVRTEIQDGRKRMIYMHREIMRPASRLLVDHINGNRLDNRRRNLRPADHSGNGQNRDANRGRDLPRGVFLIKGRYLAMAKLRGVQHRLGFFPTAELADAVVRRWRAANMPYSVEARAAR